MTVITKNRGSYIQEKEFDRARFRRFIGELHDLMENKDQFTEAEINDVYESVVQTVEAMERVESSRLFDYIIREANSRVDGNNVKYTKLAAAAFLRKMYKEASKTRGFDYKKGYGDYYSLVKRMVEEGKYSEDLLDSYTEKELRKLGKLIDPSKDKLFNYSGLQMLDSVYLVRTAHGQVSELPQERFLTAIVYMMKDEPKTKRHEYIKQAYWALSNHYIGLATPTLKNAGTPHGSLSSCHIVTVDDDLKSIFNSNTQVARFSQEGSGLGVYLGFLRARGSWIRGIKGVTTGITHPSRLLSVIADYVDQTGTRKAGIAVYLPVWHGDIFDFMDLRLKTGSQENRAHSIKTAVTIPDEFMRRLSNRENFTIFDPYEVKQKLGIDLNRLYDKKKLQDGEEPNKEDHAFTYYYREAEKADLELKRTVSATEIYKAIYISRKTGGTPYMYYADTAARMNPNAHAGQPFGSNLCTEIAQNMDFDREISEEMDEKGYVVTKVIGEGLVTCNLSSLVLQNVHNLDQETYQKVIDIQFRMLDNVISLGRLPVPQATHTNSLYRAVGAGAMGLVTLMTNEGVMWEDAEAAEFTEEVFKRNLKAQIKASHKLAKEKGSYPLFEGSDWHTGEFFEKRGLVGEEWEEYKEMASKGMRNGYISAIAPTASNSIIMNSSPSIDPLYDVIYSENKSGMNVLIVPPNYNNKTKWFYKSGFEMDEMWAINVIAAAQKYIDQAISHNMHVSENIKASEMLRLDMGTWNKGVKTTYYTHTSNMEKPDNCIMCEA